MAFAGPRPSLAEDLPSGVSEKASHLLRKLTDVVKKLLDEADEEDISRSASNAELERPRNLALGGSPEKAINTA